MIYLVSFIKNDYQHHKFTFLCLLGSNLWTYYYCWLNLKIKVQSQVKDPEWASIRNWKDTNNQLGMSQNHCEVFGLKSEASHLLRCDYKTCLLQLQEAQIQAKPSINPDAQVLFVGNRGWLDLKEPGQVADSNRSHHHRHHRHFHHLKAGSIRSWENKTFPSNRDHRLTCRSHQPAQKDGKQNILPAVSVRSQLDTSAVSR